MIRTIFIWLIKNARPLLGPSGCCRFSISCTNYAIMQLQEKSLRHACIAIIRRLLSCR